MIRGAIESSYKELHDEAVGVIVVTLDPETGESHAHGPFPKDTTEAITYASELVEELARECPESPNLETKILLLLAP